MGTKNKLQQEIYEYLKERNWLPNNKNRKAAAYAKSICLESAELLEHFQWDEDDYNLEEVLDELGDVVIYCYDLAICLDQNLEDIVRNKLNKVKKKYPINK